MQPIDAIELRAHLEWFLAGEKRVLYQLMAEKEHGMIEGLTLEQSTAASLFWSTDQTEKVIARLINFGVLHNIV
jgi:hypothetical protein